VFEEVLIGGEMELKNEDEGESVKGWLDKVFPGDGTQIGLDELVKMVEVFDTDNDNIVSRKELFDLFMIHKDKLAIYFLPQLTASFKELDAQTNYPFLSQTDSFEYFHSSRDLVKSYKKANEFC